MEGFFIFLFWRIQLPKIRYTEAALKLQSANGFSSSI